MRDGWLVLVIVVVAIAAGFYVFVGGEGPAGGGAAEASEVLVLCGGSMRAALEEIIEAYGAVSDDTVVGTYGGSGELCAQIQNSGRGDIYVCHDPFMPWAAERGLISEWSTVGYLDIVIVVPKGNPKGITGIKDLATPGLRLGIGDQTYSTSGVMTKQMLADLPYGGEIMKNVRLETKGHQARCNDVALGNLDAAIVWSVVAKLFAEKLEIIPIPVEHFDVLTTATYAEVDLRNTRVAAGRIVATENETAAKRFYDYLVGPEGRAVFARRGFRTEKIER